MEDKQKNYLTVPAAIIIAGLIVAGAIVSSRGGSGGRQPDDILPEKDIVLAPVSDKDHIVGSLDAPIVLVEFSDLECPFCKSFHSTMETIVSEYPDKVAWVYRHFPLDSIHPKAREEAKASECAAEIGGNEAFWKYVGKIFEVTPSNNGLDLSLLPKLAEEIGLDKTKFEECLASDRLMALVEDDLDEALLAGGLGTPYTVVVMRNGEIVPINGGAVPIEAMRQMINSLIEESN